MVVQAARGRMPAYVETGLNLVHVDDVAEGHRLAFERGVVGRRYILGGDNLTLRAILEIVAGLSGRRPPRLAIPPDVLMPLAWAAEVWARLAHRTEPMLTRVSLRMAQKTMFYSSASAESELGYVHRPAELAIADAIEWFSANRYLP
jgi:dihydroflavonol-4-reductase